MSTHSLWDTSEHPHQDFLMWANCMDEPLALLDEDGAVVAYNEPLGALFGFSGAEEEAELFELILSEDGQKLLAHWDGSIVSLEQPVTFLARHSPYKGQTPSRTMLWKLKPTPKQGLWLLAVRDVELAQSRLTMPTVTTSPDISSAPGKACIANLMQTRELLSTLPRIIHDLKAPNRRVRMFTQLLQRELAHLDNENVRSYCDSIVENASRNEELVEEIKDYFSLYKLIQKPSMISVHDLLDSAAHQANVPMEQLSIEGPVHLEVKLPLKLAIQAVAELLENAATHGKAAPDQDAVITIHVARQSPELGARSAWTLRISDQGQGLREGIDDLLFEPLRTGLSRASGDQSSINPRFGMGLATAHRCMLMLEGQLELLKDAPGAAFLLTFSPLS